MSDKIKPSEVSQVLLDQLKGLSTSANLDEVGTVLTVSDGVARIYGLRNAEANELLEFENGTMAIVMNLEEDNVGCVLLGPTSGIKEGQVVKRTKRIASIRVNDNMLGRVINPLGQAIDGQGDIADFIAQHEGKTIYIPAGQWQTAKRIYLRSKKGTQLIGAGMWYSEIFFTAPSDNPNTYSNRGIEATKDSLLVQGLYLNTACRQRYYNQQDSKQVGKAFMGGWGTGSVIRDCWAEHFECGGWIADYSGQGSRDLLVEHCRFRNNYADGLNCSQGSQGHTIRHCSFRNNGDDDMASWSVGKRTADISFSYCTAENNWRASSLGFFGGTAPSAHHLAIYDALESGVRVNADFQGTGFTADAIVDIHDVTILHCGCVSGTKGQTGDFWGNAQGALNIGNTQYYNVPNVHLTDIDITDSRGNAVYVRSSGGRNVSGLALERVAINGAKGFGIYYSGAIGDVTYCDLTISNCAKGEQSAHMPAYIITDCSTPVETVNHDNRQSAAVSHYYDLLGRDLGTELPRGFLLPIIVHPMQQ